MGGLRLLAGVALAASVLSAPLLVAQQQPPIEFDPTPSPSSAQIKQELEKIKKGRTLAIRPAEGMEDTEGATVLRFDNSSPFILIVLLVGPTTQRVELGPDRMQVLTIEPGAYEIAVSVVGRDLPPFYGTQRIMRRMRFVHKFVIPGT